jgi:pilus assembly protein CpaB
MALLLSLLMGIVTTILFFQYMNQFNSEKVSTEKTVEVVVAKETIEKNEKITLKKLEMVHMPVKNVLPQTVKSFKDADGMLANSMIEKGEPILPHRLGTEQEEGIYVSRKVREGFRAISVGVNMTQSVTNLIEPEDLVDVIFTKITKEPTDQVLSKSDILVQKARVLAVGRQMLTPENTKEPYQEYSSVTLELSPDDAIKLIDATQEGIINLTLNKRPVMTGDNKPKQN